VDIEKLIEVMATLRDPDGGCPWDLQQSFATIAPYTIEEAYEVADAIDRADLDDLRDELGDLLLQVVFHSQMAREQGEFDFGDVVEAISSKMIRRHPHVFGDAARGSAQSQSQAWEAHKREEREASGKQNHGVLAGVSNGLPALMRAAKLGKRAAGVGFDWVDADGALAKVHEELQEVAEARGAGDADAVAEEIGDLLFAVAQYARHLHVDPEEALRRGNRKFATRFGRLEQGLKEEQVDWASQTPDELEARWQIVKSRI
jgi:MazG family protein